MTKFKLQPFHYLSGLKSRVYTQVLAECALHGQMEPFLQLVELSKRGCEPANIVEEQGLAELCQFMRIIQN
jgi:hypothetical protein